MRFYRYLYYRLYSWNLRKWGERDDPQWNAMLGVAFMMFINLAWIGLLLQFAGIDFFINPRMTKVEVIVLAVSVLGVNYFLFVNNNQYDRLVEKFQHETSKQRFQKGIMLWLYVVASFMLVVLTALYIGSVESSG